MNIPAHLEPIRGTVLLDACSNCGDATDLTIEDPPGKRAWRCWKCQGFTDVVVTQQCTSAGEPECGKAWFIGPVKGGAKCPTCAPAGPLSP